MRRYVSLSCISVSAYANSNPLQWEMYFVRGAPEALAMTQAALLGQTFAMLSGVRMHSLQKIVQRLIDYMTESETHRLVSNISRDAYCGKSRSRITFQQQLLIRNSGREDRICSIKTWRLYILKICKRITKYRGGDGYTARRNDGTF